MTFAASPQLDRAVRKALHVFARHKPHLFKLAHENSDAATEFVSDWARAMLGVTLDAIPDAAQRWIATKTEIPSPAAFGYFAREIDRNEYRTVPAVDLKLHRDPNAWPPLVEVPKDFDRIDVLGRRAYDALKNWEAVSEVWALLWQTAPTTEERSQVRAGAIDDEMFDDAVRIVRTSRPNARTVA